MRNAFAILLAAVAATAAFPCRGEEPVALKYTRPELETKWEARIRAILAKGVIPLTDLESSLRRKDGERYLEEALAAMDTAGVALISFDGYQAPKTSRRQKGYRWGYYIHEVVNAHPDRFILATNGGTSQNWSKNKDSFISHTEEQVRGGSYPIMGEYEFRHYMSGRQCKHHRTDRDVNLALDSRNGHRLFKLGEETGVAFVIHNEPEDAALDGLEKMLKTYPKAKVINAHFGQLRHLDRETRFTPALVRRLLSSYPNLYYDLSVGKPNRVYKCEGEKVIDTVLWKYDGGRQSSTLDPAYKGILTEFSTRFVTGFDYGGGRQPLPRHIEARAKNVRLIIRDLPEEAKHNISYRNAWTLLTRHGWN